MLKNAENAVNVYQMLEARDKRVLRQRKMIEKYQKPVISFTLNIPGPVKSKDLYLRAFEQGKHEIMTALNEARYPVLESDSVYEVTGYEFCICVDGNPLDLKKSLINLEEMHAMGRLYDIDVICLDGSKVSREEVGKGPRRCILCQKEAHVCGRNRTHSLEELVGRVDKIMSDSLKDMTHSCKMDG